MKAIPLTSLLLVLTVAGCGLFSSKSKDPLIPDARSPVIDVPIPAGFTMTNDSSSKVIPGSGLRFVDHRYRGDDDLLPVVNFYKAELPKHDWAFIDQSQPSGKEVTMHFSKRSEECFVTVTSRTFDTLIHVRIDPVGRQAQ